MWTKCHSSRRAHGQMAVCWAKHKRLSDSPANLLRNKQALSWTGGGEDGGTGAHLAGRVNVCICVAKTLRWVTIHWAPTICKRHKCRALRGSGRFRKAKPFALQWSNYLWVTLARAVEKKLQNKGSFAVFPLQCPLSCELSDVIPSYHKCS